MHVLGIGRRARAQEVNFWLGVLFRAGCAVCFCSGGDREMANGEGEEQGERSGVDPSHCLCKKACPYF